MMMDAETGLAIDEDADIRQSVARILKTPIGSRVHRRTFGSLIPELIDQPATPANRLRLMAATRMAIMRHEPRVSLNAGGIAVDFDGKAYVDIDATKCTGPRAGSRLNFTVPLQ